MLISKAAVLAVECIAYHDRVLLHLHQLQQLDSKHDITSLIHWHTVDKSSIQPIYTVTGKKRPP